MEKKTRHIMTVSEFLTGLGPVCDTYGGSILMSLLKHSKVTIDKNNTYIADTVEMFSGENLGYVLFNGNSILVFDVYDWNGVQRHRFDTHKLIVDGHKQPITDPLISLEKRMRMYVDSFSGRDDITVTSSPYIDTSSPRIHSVAIFTNTTSKNVLEESPNTDNCKHVTVIGKDNSVTVIDVINQFLGDSENDYGIVDTVKSYTVRFKSDPHVNFMRSVIRENISGLCTALTEEQNTIIDTITKISLLNDGIKRVIAITGQHGCGETTVALGSICSIAKESNRTCRYITRSGEVRNRMYNMSVNGHVINKAGTYKEIPFYDIVNECAKISGELKYQAIFIDDAQNASRFAIDKRTQDTSTLFIEDLFNHTNTVVALFSNNGKSILGDGLTVSYLRKYCELNNTTFTEYTMGGVRTNQNEYIDIFGEIITTNAHVTIGDDYKMLDKYIEFIDDSKAKTQILCVRSSLNPHISAAYNGTVEDKNNKHMSDFNGFCIHGLKSGNVLPINLRWAPLCGNVTYKKYMEEHRECDGMAPYYLPDDGIKPDKFSFTVLPEHYKYIADAATVNGIHFKNTIVLIPRIVYYDKASGIVEVNTELCGIEPSILARIPENELEERVSAYIKNQLVILLTRATENMHIMVEDDALREYLKRQIENG